MSERLDMTSPTPGNWKVGNNGGCVITDDQKTADLQKRDSVDSMKYYGGPLICESCRTADAKLIAAAPDLLEALIECRDFLQKYHSQPSEEANYLKTASAAIEKATS